MSQGPGHETRVVVRTDDIAGHRARLDHFTRSADRDGASLGEGRLAEEAVTQAMVPLSSGGIGLAMVRPSSGSSITAESRLAVDPAPAGLAERVRAWLTTGIEPHARRAAIPPSASVGGRGTPSS
jgi:hypothetical protein